MWPQQSSTVPTNASGVNPFGGNIFGFSSTPSQVSTQQPNVFDSGPGPIQGATPSANFMSNQIAGSRPQSTPIFGSTPAAPTPSLSGNAPTLNLFGGTSTTPAFSSTGSSLLGSGIPSQPSNVTQISPFSATPPSTIPSFGSGIGTGTNSATSLPTTTPQSTLTSFFKPMTPSQASTPNLTQPSPFCIPATPQLASAINAPPSLLMCTQPMDLQGESQESADYFLYSFPSTAINKLLLDSSTMASKCCRSRLDLFSSHFFPKVSNGSMTLQNPSAGHAFLSKNGIDISELESKLAKIASLANKEAIPSHLKATHQKNLPLEHQRSPAECQKNINACREESTQHTLRSKRHADMKKFIMSSITTQWDSYRTGTSLGQTLVPIVVTEEKGIETPIQLPSLKSITIDHKARAFAETISELNSFRASQKSAKISPLTHFPLCNRLLSILAPFSHDPVYSGISQVLKFVSVISDEAELRDESWGSLSLECAFTRSAKSFFEKEFISHMDRMICQSPRDAILGGRPNLIDKARAYTNLKLSQRHHHKGASHSTSPSHSNTLFDAVELFHGGITSEFRDENPIYPWATLYFLIRAGAGKSHLLAWIETFESYFVRSDKYFKDVLIAFSEGKFDAGEHRNVDRLSDFVRNEYLRLESLRDTTDPFRLLIYGLFASSMKRRTLGSGGHFDKSIISSPPLAIITTFEDWIWYNLTLFREGSLLEFRTTMQQFSASYFDVTSTEGATSGGGGSSSNYFKLLFYIGLFDKGLFAMLRITATKPTIFVEVAHVSIALLYHSERLPGMNVDVPLHILRQYVTLLTAAYPKESMFVSLEYLFLISMVPTKQETCFDFLVDWMLTTGSYKAPLASISDDGAVQPGPIVKYLPLIQLTDCEKFDQTKGLHSSSGSSGPPSLLVVLAWRIATQLLSRAILEDEEEAALGLFHICSSYERIFEFLAKKLSDALLEGKIAPSVPSSIARQARGTLNFYHQHAPDRGAYNSLPCQRSISMLSLLLSLHDALSMQRNARPDKVLEGANLISFSSSDKFSIHESIIDPNEALSLNRHLGLVLELTLWAIAELYNQSSSHPMVASHLQQMVPFSVQDLKTMGRAVMLFASKLSAKIGPSCFAILTRLDAIIQ